MDIELKPCPFCGGVAQLNFAPHSGFTYINSDGKLDFMKIFNTVQCTECCSNIGIYEDINMAIDAWNKRV